MSINIFVLRRSSVIMAEGIEQEDFWLIKNPIEIVTNPVMKEETPMFSVSFLPFLQYTKEAKTYGVKFSKDEIVAVATPVEELYEHYSNFFNVNE